MTDTSGLECVVWPRSKRSTAPVELARRSPTLAGRRIGFVWDYVFRGDEVFPLLAQEIRRRYPGTTFVGYETFGPTFGGDEHRTIAELPDALRRHGVDAVISAVGC